MRILVILVGIVLSLVGCVGDGEKVVSVGEAAIMGDTGSLADVRLSKIVEGQERLFAELARGLHREGEQDRRLREIVSSYEMYLLDNGGGVYGYIHYGKFLRKVGEDGRALKVFMEANRRDGEIAVVKQQIGLILGEIGEYRMALPYMLNAVDLAPGESIYHYQLGVLLAQYRKEYVIEGMMDEAGLDRQMMLAFKQAMDLESGSWELRMRYGEAFYDLGVPMWEMALGYWRGLAKEVETQREREIINLHEGRVLMELGEYVKAKQVVAKVFVPELEWSRQELTKEIEEREG